MLICKGKERPPAFAKLKALQCHDEIRERLIAGYPPGEVARWVQEDEGAYLHVTRRSLAEMLRRYTADEIAPIDLIAPYLPHTVLRAQREFDDRLRDLRRLEAAYEVALYRLDLAHGKERRTGVIDPAVDRHMKVLIDLVVRMHGLKMDLGLTGEREVNTLTPSPERLEEIRTRYGEGAARAFADPVQRAQVLGLLKRVMRLHGKEAAADDVVVDGDGDTSATARPGAVEEAVPERPADYTSSGQDDEDEDLWEPP